MFQKLTSIDFKALDLLSSFTVGKNSLLILPDFILTSVPSLACSPLDFPALKTIASGMGSLNAATFEVAESPVETIRIDEHAFSRSSSFVLLGTPPLPSSR